MNKANIYLMKMIMILK